MAVIKLPQLAGTAGKKLNITSDYWQIETCHMTGYDLPAMTPSAIRHALDNPIGQTNQRTGKSKAAGRYPFDDMSRITRSFDFILMFTDLSEAGIPDENIRFIWLPVATALSHGWIL